jgi:ssDNA-binding Zn-finger/Zn-ribbon topoisomerase 1
MAVANMTDEKSVHRKVFAKCPKCGTVVESQRSFRAQNFVFGDCPNCKAHYTTSMFWEE